MIDRKTYETLKKCFGTVASWAVWAPPGDTVKSNTGDMSIFDDEDKLLDQLNAQYVFVGLNASEVENGNTSPWSCFHSLHPRQNDFKLRFALLGEKYWGSYITDFIKGYPKTNSQEVVKDMKNNPDLLKKHKDVFLEEISLLGHPVLVAMGVATYRLIKPLEREGYVVKKIPHYAHRINKEKYREKVLEALK